MRRQAARALYDAVGGYHDMPLMEDVDLVRRIGRHRLAALDAEIVTSTTRYRRDGYWHRPLRNLTCLSLYFAGPVCARAPVWPVGCAAQRAAAASRR